MRINKNIRQEEMADLVGMRQSTYSRKERGATEITMEEWTLIAKILEVQIDDIYRPNSKKSINSSKNTYKYSNVPLHVLAELEQLKKENSQLKEELYKLKLK